MAQRSSSIGISRVIYQGRRSLGLNSQDKTSNSHDKTPENQSNNKSSATSTSEFTPEHKPEPSSVPHADDGTKAVPTRSQHATFYTEFGYPLVKSILIASITFKMLQWLWEDLNMREERKIRGN